MITVVYKLSGNTGTLKLAQQKQTTNCAITNTTAIRTQFSEVSVICVVSWPQPTASTSIPTPSRTPPSDRQRLHREYGRGGHRGVSDCQDQASSSSLCLSRVLDDREYSVEGKLIVLVQFWVSFSHFPLPLHKWNRSVSCRPLRPHCKTDKDSHGEHWGFGGFTNS